MDQTPCPRSLPRHLPALVAALLLAAAMATYAPPAAADAATLLARAEADGAVEVLIRLQPTTGNRLLRSRHSSFGARVAATVSELRSDAAQSQRRLLQALQQRRIEYRAYWVANAVRARVDAQQLHWLRGHPDVVAIVHDRELRAELPPAGAGHKGSGIEWGVQQVGAPQVWALGHLGEGVVIGGQDTGYQWDHPALRAAYRGWNGNSANHHHNWFDAVRTGGAGNPCGIASPVPCDDDNHGTHTMGTMVGDDGGPNRIGVAPAARWIGCRNMDQGAGTVSTYLGCFEWFLAPTDLAGANPSPQLAPHVINNSWSCPAQEGCTDLQVLEEAVDNTFAAGILVVGSAGNSGPGCSSIAVPPSIYASTFTVGASTSEDAIASFSSRGPVSADGSLRLKPDLVAPGVNVRSAILGSAYGNLFGTSAAAPHVAGVAALMMSANPFLIGKPGRVAELLRHNALPLTSTQTCSGWPGSAVPNAVFGHGRVDALAAVQAALAGTLFGDGFE